MNYKMIIKSRKNRQKILEHLSFIPDGLMVSIQYYIKTGRVLNLKHPRRYSEKLQFYKLNYKNPQLISCVDKYDVREYVKSKDLENILNDCYGVYSRPDEINFGLLPEKFVIKDTLGGGSDRVVICKNKEQLDIPGIKKEMQTWIADKLVASGGREWPYYKGKKHRIIIEKFLSCNNNDLPDYKFFCFDGKCEFFFIKIDYAISPEDEKVIYFNRNKEKLDFHFDHHKQSIDKVKFPENIDEMIRNAEKLSEDFPHVRVDFYNADGKIIFGELTFYHSCGYMSLVPDEMDFKIGNLFNI